MPVDKFGRMSDTKTKDTGVSLTYINNNYIRRDGKTPVSGSIDMNGNTLFSLPKPRNYRDAATKKYVDRLIAKNVGEGSPFVKENDNFKATYPVDMGFKKLLNLSTPSEPSDAATKEYVDKVADNVNKNLEERTHLISVSASFQGDLVKNTYPFVFGGQNYGDHPRFNIFNGFLMPHSGHVKRFALKDYGLKVLRDFFF